MRQDLQQQLEHRKTMMKWAIEEIAIPHDLGHAIIWGDIPVKMKNGKTKYYKDIIAYVCASNLDECIKVCESRGAINVYLKR